MKRQLIMEKALELFAKQGYETTSVQQITDYCGISKGAFYLSFKSKDELIIALVDHFMMQIIADIDYVVIHAKDEELLYAFYLIMFNTFHKHSDFGKFLMKEQTQSFNKELLSKIRHYDHLMNKNILLMIERVYGKEVEHTKYDLIYCIKGLMNSYSSLFLFNNLPLDLDLLSRTLVEKTNLLAKHTTVPFVSKELKQMLEQPRDEEVTKENILEILEQTIKELDESVEKESIILLKQQLIEPTLSTAILKGLLENIRKHPYGKWIAYLLRKYYDF